ncbi:MAG: HAMP domain-containing protein, partial [Oxalobacteraceae bacterium]
MLKHLKISTKIIGTVVAVSLLGLALSSYASVQMNAIDNAYTGLVDNRDAAVVKLARAGRNVSDAGYSSYRTLIYDGSSAEAKESAASREDAMAKAVPLLADASAAFPEYSTDFGALSDALTKIEDLGKRASVYSLANNDEAAKPLLSQMDGESKKFTGGYQSLRDRMLALTAAESSELSAQTLSTIQALLAGTVLAMILGIGGALVVSSKGITGPLKALGLRMEQLAGGKLDVEIAGQDRRDEVGAMAKAV